MSEAEALTVQTLLPALIEVASIQADLCGALARGDTIAPYALRERSRVVLRWLLERVDQPEAASP